MWTIFVLIVSYACAEQLQISPAPFAVVDENSDLTFTCSYNGNLLPLEIRWFSDNSIENTYLDMGCVPSHGILINKTFTCNESIGKFQMTVQNAHRDKNGQTWRCELRLSNSTSAHTNWTMVNVRDNLNETSSPNTKNPVSTTISPEQKSTSSTMQSTSIVTEMIPTTEPQPSYMPDPAPNTTHPVSTTLSPDKKSTSSTMQSTSIVTEMIPTTEPQPSYMPDPGEYELQLEFDLKVKMEYISTYANKSSPEFQSLATNFSVSLTEVFKNLQGFKSIDILRFRRGSVVVDYSVNVFATVDVATVTEEIGNKIIMNLTSIGAVHVDTAYTHESMTKRLGILKTKDKCSLASENLCPFGYYCKPATTSVILCIDRCNSSVCQNNGECYVGHHSQDVQCRCPLSENAVYTGERCGTKTEVMTEHERSIYLIIACSIIGGILLVFISTVCVINRKRKQLKKRITINHGLKLDEMHRMSDNCVPAMDERYFVSINPALKRYPEGYFDRRGHLYHQDQGIDDGYMQVQDSGRHNDPNYDYLHPRFEI